MIEHSDETWMAVIGKGITPEGEIKNEQQHYQNQVVQTMAKLLGLVYTNERKPGPVIEDIFEE